jgi:crotonobetainyl-CoA:carnitine CoA-transferase CaiB-like acyl-CoA transferase
MEIHYEWRHDREQAARHLPDRRKPIKFSDFTPAITGSPLLGEHTDEALAELGYDADQIASMRASKVVA